MLWIITGIISSYLLGSIPTAYIFGRALKGIDIRKHGSGNIGATNALRVLGKGAGITVLILDMLKGFAAVVLLGMLVNAKQSLIPAETIYILLGITCVCGHNWTIFLRFKGGKGVATTLGVLLGLSVELPGFIIIFGLSILTWLIMFLIVRIVSIASVVTGISLPIFMFLFKQSTVVVSLGILLCLLIVVRHRPNLSRFFRGEEKRLSFRKKPQ